MAIGPNSCPQFHRAAPFLSYIRQRGGATVLRRADVPTNSIILAAHRDLVAVPADTNTKQKELDHGDV